MGVNFHSLIEGHSLKKKSVVRKWVKEIIDSHGFKCGVINIILLDDEGLLKMNKDFLKHDFYTDIITFNYNHNDKISGDIFMSMQRISDNAKSYSVSVEKETLRVIVHGLLHLLGYDDKLQRDKELMTWKENEMLEIYNARFHK